ARRGGRGQPAGHAGARKGFPDGTPHDPRARSPRSHGRAPVRLPRRGDRDPGRGPDPRAHHDRRQSGPQHAERRPAGARARRARVHGEPGHLPERDDPGCPPPGQSPCALALWRLAVRNYPRWSPPVFAPPADRPADWEVLLRLTGIVVGQGPAADTAALDDFVARQQVEAALGAPPLAGRDPNEIMAALAPRRGPDRPLDLLLRTGP